MMSISPLAWNVSEHTMLPKSHSAKHSPVSMFQMRTWWSRLPLATMCGRNGWNRTTHGVRRCP